MHLCSICPFEYHYFDILSRGDENWYFSNVDVYLDTCQSLYTASKNIISYMAGIECYRLLEY